MKKVILFILFMPYLAVSQVSVDFETGLPGSWLQVPQNRWKSDAIQSINGNFSLHHAYDNPENGTDIISVMLNDFHPGEGKSTWSFKVRHGYDPSSSNNWAVYLAAESSALAPGSNILNGIAIGVNISGSDDSLRLLKIKDGTISTVCRTGVNWQTDVGTGSYAEITVRRESTGTWNVTVTNSNGQMLSSSTGFDNYLPDCYYFAVLYKYTSTKDQLLWIDDVRVEGIFYRDEQPPKITECMPSGKKLLRVKFSEEPVDGSIIPGNFSVIPGNITPSEIVRLDPLTFVLNFNEEFVNKEISTLSVKNICDKAGNCNDTQSTDFLPLWAEAGDIVISEIMADPSPVVALPDAEYIEIANCSNYGFNLEGWFLVTSNKNYDFPEIYISAGERIILCHSSDTSSFSIHGRTAGFISFPVLKDDGEVICISDSSGSVIDGIEYSSEWYNDVLKKEGGWSLEVRSVKNPFSDEENWLASTSAMGGTPGKRNSVEDNYSDHSFYGIENVYATDPSNIEIRFSEPLLQFEKHPEYLDISGKEIEKIEHTGLLFKTFHVTLKSPLLPNTEYTAGISPLVKDFSGNAAERRSLDFGITEKAGKGDIIFNELLFNPQGEDPDYVELYNISSRIVDASRLLLISVDTENSDTSSLYPFSFENRCILPGCYYLITPSKRKVIERYPFSDEERIFEMKLPSMPDNNGHLVLLNRELEKIDEVIYTDQMHSRLLRGHEGISLEKANPLLSSLSSESWHSAAESSGWGTPGAPNSIFSEIPDSGEGVVFSSTRITPDSDGFEDVLIIRASLSGLNNIISITIFNEAGNLVRTLASNSLSGPEMVTSWDGTDRNGDPVRTGIYIILISMYDEDGSTRQWKKVCTVVR